ncbi:MAG: glycine cleavage system aminomethyltransferase GcvT, partial [Nitrospinota bacterium]
ISGPGAKDFVQYLTTNDVNALALNQVQYSTMCYPDGGIVDDLTVYRLAEDRFLFCVNASNADKDYEWVKSHARGEVEMKNTSSQTAQLALQGPRAQDTLKPLVSIDLGSLQYYWSFRGEVDGVPALISRTGYTGEDGFELYLEWEAAPRVWKKLMEVGRAFGLKACGLGARDTLRMEVKYALYGNDITADTSPLEAGLGWVVKLKKGDFIGRDALVEQKAQGIKRKLVGLELLDRGIPRSGNEIYAGEQRVGSVTSGTMSPTLGKPIGIGYVAIAKSEVGSPLEVDIRGKRRRAVVVKTPFYRRT